MAQLLATAVPFDQAGNIFSDVKPGDTAFEEEGLRDFFDSLSYNRLS